MPEAPFPLFPLFLDLRGRPVLVVGAGTVAAAKLPGLLQAGAAVTVVAPAAVPAIQDLAAGGALTLVPRAFCDADLDGAWLVLAATADAGVNARVAQAAAARRVFTNAVDDPARASAYAGAVVRRGPVVAAISSGGRAPALSRLLRETLEELLPDTATLTRWAEHAGELRAGWRARGVPMAARYPALLRRLLEREAARGGVDVPAPASDERAAS